MREARGEQKRGGLAEDASGRKNAAGHDPVDAARQHDRAHHAPFARAEAERALAVALRDSPQAFLRRAQDGRQVHDHERQRAREQGGLHPQKFTEKQHTDQTVDDGRDARERLGGVFDGRDELFVLRVLREVHGRAHAERQDDEQRSEQDLHRVADIRQNADRAGDVARLRREQVPRDIRQALAEHVHDHEHDQRGRQYGGQH